jgi:hypothetical protein
MIEDVTRARSSGPTVLVTTEDETVLHCTPRVIVSAEGRQSAWVLVEENGSEYIGPEYLGFTSMRDILKTINDWWRAKKERG